MLNVLYEHEVTSLSRIERSYKFTIFRLSFKFECHCQRKPGSTKGSRSAVFLHYSKRLMTMTFAEVGVCFSSRYHHIMILASGVV